MLFPQGPVTFCSRSLSVSSLLVVQLPSRFRCIRIECLRGVRRMACGYDFSIDRSSRKVRIRRRPS